MTLAAPAPERRHVTERAVAYLTEGEMEWLRGRAVPSSISQVLRQLVRQAITAQGPSTL
jgi:hypothetical protein